MAELWSLNRAIELVYSDLSLQPCLNIQNSTMTESQHQGVMAMVKIDGGKVRRLREQKSLTQLYVATAVQVTTDTISRWENRRYPTIKRENALKLAEALEVDLAEILEKLPESERGNTIQDPPDQQLQSTTTEPLPPQKQRGAPARWPILLLSATISALIALAGWFFLTVDKAQEVMVTARRNLPSHCIPGQPFPVSIEVNVQSDKPLAFIVKEQLPAGAQAGRAMPSASSSGKSGSILKWLQKAHGILPFIYIATIEEPYHEDDEFTGGIASNEQSNTSHPIIGDSTIMVSSHHWADRNRDNKIDDSEILTVYDQFGEIEELGLDLDLIEEIWLGSGYSWNPATKNYEILP